MSEIPRTFVHKNDIDAKTDIISISDKDEIYHLTKVLRINLSDTIIVLDGMNSEYKCEITNIAKSLITLKIINAIAIKPYPSFNLTLIQAIAKGDKQDLTIQKCTELGVNNIISVTTDYSNVQFKDEISIIKKQSRWQKVALNAAKQSKRSTVPSISIIENLKTLFESNIIDFKNDTVIACVENEKTTSIKTALQENKQQKKNTYVLIGPEGGWSNKELDLFNEYNLKQVHLGRNILRCETASILAIGIVLYELEL